MVSFLAIREGIIYFIHQSAKDYLVTGGAQRLFPASLREEHGVVVNRSLDTMSSILRKDMCALRHPGASARSASIGTHLKAISYACSFWLANLMQYLGDNSVDGPSYEEHFSDRGRAYKFFRKYLLHWLEALSLIGEIDKGIMGLYSLETTLIKSSSESTIKLKEFVHDAIRVLRQFRTAVEEAPLQAYSSALIFSPEKSTVRQTFKQEIFASVAFSPDRQQLASSSDDGALRLWDAGTGDCLQTLEGYTENVSFPDASISFANLGPLGVRQTLQPGHAQWEGFGIEGEKKWITWNGNHLLWLPPEYRPLENTVKVKGNCVGIGCPSGVVYFLNFGVDVLQRSIQ